jgi:methylmalonyl-CoA mutase C-terminal domain/subunit
MSIKFNNHEDYNLFLSRNKKTVDERVLSEKFLSDSGGIAEMKKIRVLIGKPGLDGHDRGAKYIARALRDAGMEVIYTGIRQTPEQIVAAAIQEDVDAIGLSLLSGAHNFLFSKVADLLKEKDIDDILLFGGGVIPEDDIPLLKEKGFKAIFTPGTSTKEVVQFLTNELSNKV